MKRVIKKSEKEVSRLLKWLSFFITVHWKCKLLKSRRMIWLHFSHLVLFIYLIKPCGFQYKFYSPLFSTGSITYTEFLNGYIGTNQYANFDAANVNFVKCSKLCNSDQFCNGFIFNSATRQCRHVDSSSVVPFSDAKFSFYRKDCPLGKHLLSQTQSLFQIYSR